ncbi:MAG: universal stress protein [Gammaproteobacteria bacterium]|jgi:universal stress protein E
MNRKATINTVLVVLGPDLVRPEQPMKSALLERAVALAKARGCVLELFHVCHDTNLDAGLFADDDRQVRNRKRLLDDDATRLAELAARLGEEQIDVNYEVRWDHPRTDAILRKIVDVRPDLVMKQARDHRYLFGIRTNTDWELGRRSPANVWLVNERIRGIDRIVAAVGNDFGDPADITTPADYDLLRAANTVATSLRAEIFPVNAYQLPTPPQLLAGIGATSVAPTSMQQSLREQTSRQHSGAVRAVASYFDIDRDNVRIHEGQPNVVIPQVARSVEADMIAMGAKTIGRLERLVRSLTFEPVMAGTDCDILIVREGDASQVPDAVPKPLRGEPKYDLNKALTWPQAVFDSPAQVARQSAISCELRNRILQAWEYDIRAEMLAESEGGTVKDIDAGTLDEIEAAKARLEQQGPDGPSPADRPTA